MFYPFRDFQAFMLASGFDLSELHGGYLDSSDVHSRLWRS